MDMMIKRIVPLREETYRGITVQIGTIPMQPGRIHAASLQSPYFHVDEPDDDPEKIVRRYRYCIDNYYSMKEAEALKGRKTRG